jgi:hypothetical protein
VNEDVLPGITTTREAAEHLRVDGEECLDDLISGSVPAPPRHLQVVTMNGELIQGEQKLQAHRDRIALVGHVLIGITDKSEEPMRLAFKLD